MRTHFFHPVRRIIALLLVMIIQASAQSGGPFELKWSTIDGGGSTSIGGPYSLSGTVGQPDAGELLGGNFAVQGGFWSLFGIVQTQGAPRLRITRDGLDAVNVWWPAPSSGWVLQQTDLLASTPEFTVWTDVVAVPTVVNGEKKAKLEIVSNIRYFRLRHP